jgi:hypothetical protein
MDTFGFVLLESTPDDKIPAIGYVYVKSSLRRPLYLLTAGSSTWQAFEQELNRLQRELQEIRQEAHLRFAQLSAERYGAVPSEACRLSRSR